MPRISEDNSLFLTIKTPLGKFTRKFSRKQRVTYAMLAVLNHFGYPVLGNYRLGREVIRGCQWFGTLDYSKLLGEVGLVDGDVLVLDILPEEEDPSDEADKRAGI